MIQIILRNSKSDIGTLAVRVVNRNVGINTNISLHLKIKLKDWSETAQLPKNMYDERPVKELNGLSYAQLANTVQDIKKLLMALDDANAISLPTAKSVINEVVNKEKFGDMVPQNDPSATRKITFTEFVDQYVADCESGNRLKMKSSKKITYGTIKGLRSFSARIKEYQEKRKRVIDWDDINLEFYNDFKQYYLSKGYSPNTIGGFVKKMKTILFAAKEQHLTTRDDFTSRQWFVDSEDVENIYITEKRLKEMYEINLTDRKKVMERLKKYAKDDEERILTADKIKTDTILQRLSEARDIFLMGCLTGQRVSDYKRINDDMIETIQGDRKFVHLIQVKTEKDVYIPYNIMIRDILDKYDGKLPSMCDQHLNRFIKIVGLLLGWTEPAGLMERRGLMQIPSEKRFCDAIVTHTARRTFATNAYKKGVPLSAIMAVTGHSSEEMLRRYLKLNTKERALLAAAEFDKVKSAF